MGDRPQTHDEHHAETIPPRSPTLHLSVAKTVHLHGNYIANTFLPLRKTHYLAYVIGIAACSLYDFTWKVFCEVNKQEEGPTKRLLAGRYVARYNIYISHVLSRYLA